jgi:hypothetical protein
MKIIKETSLSVDFIIKKYEDEFTKLAISVMDEELSPTMCGAGSNPATPQNYENQNQSVNIHFHGPIVRSNDSEIPLDLYIGESETRLCNKNESHLNDCDLIEESN